MATLEPLAASAAAAIEVKGGAEGGFASSIVFDADRSLPWSDVHFMIPGCLYGDPSYNGERSPGGTQNYAARRLVVREDILPAPLFAMSFPNKCGRAHSTKN